MIIIKYDTDTCGVRVSFLIRDAALGVDFGPLTRHGKYEGEGKDEQQVVPQNTETLTIVKTILEEVRQHQLKVEINNA